MNQAKIFGMGDYSAGKMRDVLAKGKHAFLFKENNARKSPLP